LSREFSPVAERRLRARRVRGASRTAVGGCIVKASKGTGSGYWMALPALLTILAIVAYPLAFATYFGFRKVLPNVAGEFVGLENYSRMLEDPHFAEALGTTLVFTAASGGLSFFAGLGLALLLSRPFTGRGALAAAAFLPWVFPPVVVATFGRLALFSGVGPVSRIAEALGFGTGELLLLDNGVLLTVAVIVDAWRTAPFVALLLLAGLRTIPEDVYEAARVDGAGVLQRFFSITLPLLMPSLLVVLLLRLLDAFRVFDLFRVLGDRNLTSLSTYVYQNVMLSQINFGLGNAAAVFMFLCAFLASLFFAFVLRAQASTGLAHSGLQRDGAVAVAGRGYGRSGLALGTLGGILSVLFLAPLTWVFWVSVAHAPGARGGAVTGPSLLRRTTDPCINMQGQWSTVQGPVTESPDATPVESSEDTCPDPIDRAAGRRRNLAKGRSPAHLSPRAEDRKGAPRRQALRSGYRPGGCPRLRAARSRFRLPGSTTVARASSGEHDPPGNRHRGAHSVLRKPFPQRNRRLPRRSGRGSLSLCPRARRRPAGRWIHPGSLRDRLRTSPRPVSPEKAGRTSPGNRDLSPGKTELVWPVAGQAA
jgi:trehalose/maltose transport system permease protein